MSTTDATHTAAPAAPLPSAVAALCLPSTWPMLAPALLHRRLPHDGGAELVQQWLNDSAPRVGAPARDALRQMGCQLWTLHALPADREQHPGLEGWLLQVGAQRWALWCMPVPHTRLMDMQALA